MMSPVEKMEINTIDKLKIVNKIYKINKISKIYK